MELRRAQVDRFHHLCEHSKSIYRTLVSHQWHCHDTAGVNKYRSLMLKNMFQALFAAGAPFALSCLAEAAAPLTPPPRRRQRDPSHP